MLKHQSNNNKAIILQSLILLCVYIQVVSSSFIDRVINIPIIGNYFDNKVEKVCGNASMKSKLEILSLYSRLFLKVTFYLNSQHLIYSISYYFTNPIFINKNIQRLKLSIE